MLFKAAVLIKKNKIKILNLKKPDLKPNQVFVKIIYSSICHTQLQEIRGLRGFDKFLPHCLGHEGIGKIIEKHKTVKKVNIKNYVCLSWINSRGKNAGGIVYESENGQKINAGPVHTFAEYAVISENKIYKIKNEKNLKTKLLLSCALSTAYNALNNNDNNTSKTICIVGCGGLGLSCILIAKQKYKKIIVIDRNTKKLIIAKKIGGMDAYSSIDEIPASEKIDVIVECTGNIDVLIKSINLPKKFGGKVIIIGNYPKNKNIELDPWIIIDGVTMTGAWTNSKPFDQSFKKLEKLIKNYNLNFFFSRKLYSLDNFSKAIKDFEDGEIIRPLIKM